MSSRGAGVLVFAVAIAACTATTTGTGQPSSSSSGSSATTDCQSRCANKANSCGTAEPAKACPNICNGSSFTAEQLDCLEKKACGELANAGSLDLLCPRNAPSGDPCSEPSDCTGIPRCVCYGEPTYGEWRCVSNQCTVDCSVACP